MKYLAISAMVISQIIVLIRSETLEDNLGLIRQFQRSRERDVDEISELNEETEEVELLGEVSIDDRDSEPSHVPEDQNISHGHFDANLYSLTDQHNSQADNYKALHHDEPIRSNDGYSNSYKQPYAESYPIQTYNGLNTQQTYPTKTQGYSPVMRQNYPDMDYGYEQYKNSPSYSHHVDEISELFEEIVEVELSGGVFIVDHDSEPSHVSEDQDISHGHFDANLHSLTDQHNSQADNYKALHHDEPIRSNDGYSSSYDNYNDSPNYHVHNGYDHYQEYPKDQSNANDLDAYIATTKYAPKKPNGDNRPTYDY